MPKLDRVVRVFSRGGALPDNAGVTATGGDPVGFTLSQDWDDTDTPAGGFNIYDVVLTAVDANGDPVTGTVAGRWAVGSQISWVLAATDYFATGASSLTPRAPGQKFARFERDFVWTAPAMSLRYGVAAVPDKNTAGVTNPTITVPSWQTISSEIAGGTPQSGGGFAVGVTDVDTELLRVPELTSSWEAWASLLDESYTQQTLEVELVPAVTFGDEGQFTIPAVDAQQAQVDGLATFWLRYDSRIQPMDWIVDQVDGEAWLVNGVKRLRARGRFMEVECTNQRLRSVASVG